MNGSEKCSPNEFTADYILPKRSLSLESAIINSQGQLEVVINKQTLRFPTVWLRHNCQCDECYNHDCLSYKFVMSEIVKLEMKLKSVSKTENGVRCVFADDHSVEFCTDWLYNRRMTGEGSKERAEHLFVHKMVPWTDPENLKIQKRTYQQVTETDQGLAAMSSALIKDGVFKITDAPDREIYKEFGEKTGMLPIATHYQDRFIVTSVASPFSFAYTNKPIDFHSDLPHLVYYPCIQLLHCVKQSKVGGENLLADGLHAAFILKERNPEYYRVLTTTKVQHEDVIAHKGEKQYFMAGCNPIIVLGADGEPRYVRLSGSSHSSFFPGTPEDYENFAKALKEFYSILYETKVQLKSDEGDILVFDNQRLMHGRLGFPSNELRSLEGWYIDWDAVYSNYRIAKIKGNLPTEEK